MPSVSIAYPPLREGDRLDSNEFLRRWEAMPDLKQPELIDGIVQLLPSPACGVHSVIHYGVTNWLSNYSAVTPGCEGGLEGTGVMGAADVPQPDISLRILPEFGGQSRDVVDSADGAPELVVEVSGSGLSRGLGDKLDRYRRAAELGVQSAEHAAFVKKLAAAHRRK